MVIECDPNPLYIKAKPIRSDNVGQGIKPNGEAYKYLNNDSVLSKCG
jgi:hypothetical protein